MCQWKVVRMEADVQKIQRGPAFLPDTDDEDDGETEAAPPVPAAAHQPLPRQKKMRMEDDEDGEEMKRNQMMFRGRL